MKIIVLSANLGNFDRAHRQVAQTLDCDWHSFTDKDFPPITGLSPRLQYRIPKTHGWQMKPGYDIYIWLDGSMGFINPEGVQWLVDQLGNDDFAVFRHPDRGTAREETNYIEARKDHPYIKSRYENGLHQEQMAEIEATSYPDDNLYASTVFVYRNNRGVQEMMKEWLYTSVRYFTCDQIALPYLLWRYGLSVKAIDMNPFNNPYLGVLSKHR